MTLNVSERQVLRSASNTDASIVAEEAEPMFKVVIIGNTNVGKTALMLRYADDVFRTQFISTIGVDFKIARVKVGETFVRLQIWDTAGQDRFRTISSTYYRGAHGAIIVYDVTSFDSFNNVECWLDEMKHHDKDIFKIMVGNKNDSQYDAGTCKMVSFQDAQELSERLCLRFFETSAKEDINVKEMFEYLAQQLLERHQQRKSQVASNQDNNLNKPRKSIIRRRKVC